MSVQITINDQPLTVEKGITILQAARLNQIFIPTLCDHPSLPSHGSCRLCVIEIQGKATTPTACSTPVEDGMSIYTHSPKIQALRGELFQMLLAEHPSCCLFCSEKNHCDECMVTVRKVGVTTGCRSCPNDRQCEIQDLAETINLTQVDYPIRYRMLKAIHSDPFIDRDYNLCVLCGRCVRICQSQHFSSPVTFLNRGSDIVIDTVGGRSLQEAGCRFCGSCVEICPTGALSEKTRKWLGKAGQQTRTTCPFCSLGCSMEIFSRNDQVIGGLPFHENPGSGHLCVLGRFGIPEMIHHPNRLTSPVKTVGKDRMRVSWDEALDRTVEALAACPPGQFQAIVSASCSNEDLFVAQKFTRRVMKSNQITTRAGETYGDGFKAVIQLLGGSSPLEELAGASTVLCLGMDDRYSQSVVERDVYRAKTDGANVITLSPRPHSLTDFADIWLKPDPGKEAEVLRLLAQYASDEKTRLAYQKGNGLPKAAYAAFEDAAHLLREPGRPVIIAGTSYLTHPDNRRLLGAVQDLQKSIAAKVIALPAEANLLGSVLMGVYPGVENDSSPDPKESPELDGGPCVTYLIGEVVTAPRRANEVVIYQHFISPPDGLEPDILLPAAAFAESSVTTINYEGRVQFTAQAVPPPGEALPTWQILCRIAQKLGVSGFDFSSPEEIRSEIRGVQPDFAIDQMIDRSVLVRRAEHFRLTQTEALDNLLPASQAAPPAPLYMGFPITDWVEGLRSLYPGKVSDSSNLEADGTVQPQKMSIPR